MFAIKIASASKFCVPRRRVSTQQTHLPKREVSVCSRVKEARERLGLDQTEAARRVGVQTHVLSSVEKFRSPLRFEVALRFCRELMINEEWLATGGTASLDEALRSMVPKANVAAWEKIFFRTPLNLQNHPAAKAIEPRTRFSDAFSQHFLPLVPALSKANWLIPSLSPGEYDRSEFRAEYLAALVERWRSIIQFQATDKGVPVSALRLVETDLVDDITKAAMLIFFRSMGLPTPQQSHAEFGFIRTIAADDHTPIGTLGAIHAVTVKRGEVTSSEPLLRSKKQGPPRKK